ncbi:MAG: tRNA (adenosine(37)-N6)-threonylcarbamoyltransferase complex transferase subunit TsaD [Bdellovibrionales bacterium]
MERVLAIESSCDDTSVAIVRSDGYVEVNTMASQEKEHAIFGGVVPEIASRNHSHNLLPLIEIALQKTNRTWGDIDGIAVTSQPGLIGSLLVGVVTAKTLGLTKSKDIIGVNHLEGHLLAPFLKDESYAPPEDFSYPYIGLAVSGGHSSLYYVRGLGDYDILGSTVDDAAGEAFDKFAKLAGLGYPGGVEVDKYSKKGDPLKYSFPRGMMSRKKSPYQFSFSGLKTSGQKVLQSLSREEIRTEIHDLCASYQEAIVDALLTKLDWAVDEFFIQKNLAPKAVITGGVSANSRLREKSKIWSEKKGIQLVIPPIRYCTDNAAMIGYAGIQRMNRGERSDLSLGASPKSTIMEQACSQ